MKVPAAVDEKTIRLCKTVIVIKSLNFYYFRKTEENIFQPCDVHKNDDD